MITTGDLVMKVVGVFVTDGIKRAYQEVKGGIKRRQVVDKALSGISDADDARLQRAFDDLAILIGNSKGVLTENVAAFLREVEKSAIPEAIIRCALTSGDIKLIYPAFELIYGSFTELPFPCQNFFDAFCTAIKLSLEAEVKDPTLLEFIQAQHGEITRQLADVSRALLTGRSSNIFLPVISSPQAKALRRYFDLTCSTKY